MQLNLKNIFKVVATHTIRHLIISRNTIQLPGGFDVFVDKLSTVFSHLVRGRLTYSVNVYNEYLWDIDFVLASGWYRNPGLCCQVPEPDCGCSNTQERGGRLCPRPKVSCILDDFQERGLVDYKHCQNYLFVCWYFIVLWSVILYEVLQN